MHANDDMPILAWGATDPGRVRSNNEDALLVASALRLFVVCDGMGGHAAGEVASAMACEVARELVEGNRELFERYASRPDAGLRQDILALLEFTVQTACARIFELAQRDVERRGMGTTLSLLVLCGARGFIAHVGDSRVYLLRQGQVHQLTEDHSLVNELRKRGKLEAMRLDKMPFKNAVTRAVGVYETVEVDTLDLDVVAGDRFLLCSDGLHNYFVDEASCLPLVSHEPAREAPQRCIEFANRKGGRDNITALLVAVGEAARGDNHTRRVQRSTEMLRGLELFAGCSYTSLARVMAAVTHRDLEVGADPFAARSDALFVIYSGRVAVHLDAQPLMRLEAGAAFGLLGLIDGQAPAARYVVEEAARLLELPRERLLEVTQQDEALAARVYSNLSTLLTRQLRQAAPPLALVGHLSPRPRSSAPPPLPGRDGGASGDPGPPPGQPPSERGGDLMRRPATSPRVPALPGGEGQGRPATGPRKAPPRSTDLTSSPGFTRPRTGPQKAPPRPPRGGEVEGRPPRARPPGEPAGAPEINAPTPPSSPWAREASSPSVDAPRPGLPPVARPPSSEALSAAHTREEPTIVDPGMPGRAVASLSTELPAVRGRAPAPRQRDVTQPSIPAALVRDAAARDASPDQDEAPTTISEPIGDLRAPLQRISFSHGSPGRAGSVGRSAEHEAARPGDGRGERRDEPDPSPGGDGEASPGHNDSPHEPASAGVRRFPERRPRGRSERPRFSTRESAASPLSGASEVDPATGEVPISGGGRRVSGRPRPFERWRGGFERDAASDTRPSVTRPDDETSS